MKNQSQTVDSILSHLKHDLTLVERESFLETLLTSPDTLKLVLQVEPHWKAQIVKLQIDIENTKEFIRLYTEWNKGYLQMRPFVDHTVLCQQLDAFLLHIKHNPNASESSSTHQLSSILGKTVIQCFVQKQRLLFQLEADLSKNEEKAWLTLNLTMTLLRRLQPDLFENNSPHALGFFSSEKKESAQGYEDKSHPERDGKPSL